ncbi:hypothetical protein OG311_01450 [Streptomyces sp. NBC_01343]|uniref:hypothetical protein n=1 Tax=Streptomyces sp. NBC_01343 TaxID=2903832 RepID=UPI002E114EF7|nr:hypothetical protein OG311_01450 [Streptomyces sp. NBC_01343]
MAAQDRGLGATARALLDQLDPGIVDQAAARVKKRKRTAAARSTVKPLEGDLIERYRAGEHEQVWEELAALDRRPPKALAAQAEAHGRTPAALAARLLSRGRLRGPVGQ